MLAGLGYLTVQQVETVVQYSDQVIGLFKPRIDYRYEYRFKLVGKVTDFDEISPLSICVD